MPNAIDLISARLVAKTMPVIPEIADTQDVLAYCARVSNPSNQANTETYEKLLRYCLREGHFSVFEMCNLVLEIVAPRDITRQLLRHRSFSFQEFSQRYSVVEHEFVAREARLQDIKNRQASLPCTDESLLTTWEELQRSVHRHARLAYAWAIEHGLAKEQARTVLPEGMTLSRLYVNGTARSWLHYCKLRMHPSTQREHRVLAERCWQVVTDVLPVFKTIDIESKSETETHQ